MSKKQNGLENKKTSELLDSISLHVDESGHIDDEYDKILDELKSREPFFSINNSNDGQTLQEEITALWDEIKKLKRHKHDEKTGDVMIRV